LHAALQPFVWKTEEDGDRPEWRLIWKTGRLSPPTLFGAYIQRIKAVAPSSTSAPVSSSSVASKVSSFLTATLFAARALVHSSICPIPIETCISLRELDVRALVQLTPDDHAHLLQCAPQLEAYSCCAKGASTSSIVQMLANNVPPSFTRLSLSVDRVFASSDVHALTRSEKLQRLRTFEVTGFHVKSFSGVGVLDLGAWEGLERLSLLPDWIKWASSSRSAATTDLVTAFVRGILSVLQHRPNLRSLTLHEVMIRQLLLAFPKDDQAVCLAALDLFRVSQFPIWSKDSETEDSETEDEVSCPICCEEQGRILEVQCCGAMICQNCLPRWLRKGSGDIDYCFNCRSDVKDVGYRVPWLPLHLQGRYTRSEPTTVAVQQCRVRWPKLEWVPYAIVERLWTPLTSLGAIRDHRAPMYASDRIV